MGEKATNIIKQANAALEENLSQLANYEHHILDINTELLKIPNFHLSEKILIEEFDNLIRPLRQNFKNKPCIYFFEFKKGEAKVIRDAYKNLNQNNKSALKKTLNNDTTCLYVGRSKGTIINRLKAHLGYKNTTENAMQLLHWAKPLKLQLKLNIFIFPKELDFLLPLYEATFHKNYKPLIGHL